MQAIILAAGMGKRLKELTQDRTKCMVQVNGVALIDRMLHQIESRHLSRIVIVVGYEGEKLMKYIDTLGIRTPIVYVQNPIYDKTNNIYSLALAKDYLCQDDTLLFESDLIFEDAVIDQLLDDPRETLALVDKYESWMDGTCVKLGPDDSIASFVPSKNFRFEVHTILLFLFVAGRIPPKGSKVLICHFHFLLRSQFVPLFLHIVKYHLK